MSMGHWWNDTDRKVKYSEKSLPHCHFIDFYLTWTALELNLELTSEGMATTA
jgi:hypothetical protein